MKRSFDTAALPAVSVPGSGDDGFGQWWRQLLACRLCRNLTLAAFLAILVIETVILIPSYRNYEETLLRQQAALASQALVTFQSTHSGSVTEAALARLLANSPLTGVELWNDGHPVRAGEAVIGPADMKGPLRLLPRPQGDRLELSWRTAESGGGNAGTGVHAHLDIGGVDDQLLADRTRSLHQTRQELQIRTCYDQLTGLANRSLFEERLGRVLQEIGRRLARLGHGPGTVAWLGGDVFGIVLQGHPGLAGSALEAKLEAIVRACVEPITLADQRYECDLSAVVSAMRPCCDGVTRRRGSSRRRSSYPWPKKPG